MKKVMKKMLAVMTCLVMVLALTLTAKAATVTVPEKLEGHTFKAYQIFTGTQAESEGPLGDAEWGTGIDSESFLSALKTDLNFGEVFKDCETALDVAMELNKVQYDANIAKTFAKLAYAHKTNVSVELKPGENTLNTGYYLIVDESEELNNGDYALNKALLQVTDHINIGLKTDKPSVEKKVQEDDKYNQDGGYGHGYNDVADWNMGDAVPFKLIGTVPEMTYYDTYKYIFHDTLSAGLTLNEDSIKVYVASDKAGTDKEEITGWTKAVNGQAFTVSFNDLKPVTGVSAGKYIIVEYTATLNQNAEVGLPGNPNEVYLEYSNNPDHSGSGDIKNTGTTPEDKVIVFTYELDTTKVDADDNNVKLDGAEFKFHDVNNKWVVVNEEGKVIGWSDTEEGGSTLTSDKLGVFRVIGLDDGTYYLKETKAPAGYNLLTNEITVVIKATTSNGQDWTDGNAESALTKLDVTADGKLGMSDMNNGIVGITVTNNKGSKLPETGGIGNYVYYAGGLLLIACAGFYFSKKRKA